MKISKIIFNTFILIILLTACGPVATEPVSYPQWDSTPLSALSETEAPVTVESPTSKGEAEDLPTVVPPASEEPVQSEEQAVLSSFSQPVTASGEPLVLYGHVLDASGAPLSGYAVEIWQVDAKGIYDHPGDSNNGNRDMGFQFYGTALTDENGLFAFRTLVPARYEPRPRHIHFKVKKDGAVVLTSQFYLVGDVDPAQLGPAGEMLLLDLRETTDGSGIAAKLAVKDIVVTTGTGGNLSLTPSQGEGPFYPVTEVAAFDNDLANVQ